MGLKEIFQQLYYLDRSGVALMESLKEVTENLPRSPLKRTFLKVTSKLEQGESLSQACQAYPRTFSPMMIELLKVGEISGSFTPYFKSIFEHLSWQEKTYQKLKKTFHYGVLMLFLLGSLLTLALMMLLPQMESFLKTLGIQDLPFMTQLLLKTASNLSSWKTWAGLIFIFLLLGITLYELPFLLWSAPGIGLFIRLKNLTPFLKTLSTLLAAKVDLRISLQQALSTIPSKPFRKRLEPLFVDISEGALLSEALTNTKVIPSVILRLIHLGEKTGNLAVLVEQSSLWCEEIYAQRTDEVLSLLHPTMVVMMGVMILWIVLAVLWPLYEHLGTSLG